MNTPCFCSTWLAEVDRFGTRGSITKVAHFHGWQIGAGCMKSLSDGAERQGHQFLQCGPFYSLHGFCTAGD